MSMPVVTQFTSFNENSEVRMSFQNDFDGIVEILHI